MPSDSCDHLPAIIILAIMLAVVLSIPHRRSLAPLARFNLGELGRRRQNVHFVRGNQFRIGYFGRNLDSLPAALFLRLGEEGQPILMVQVESYILQVRVKAYRAASDAEVIRFAAGFFRQTREIYLPPIVLPVAVPEVPRSRGVNAVDDDPGPRGIVDRRVQVGI